MSETITLEQIDEIADHIRSRTSYRPRVGMILGSGLGTLAANVEAATILPYQELPDWPLSTVQGHQGHLVFGQLEGQEGQGQTPQPQQPASVANREGAPAGRARQAIDAVHDKEQADPG